MKACKILSNTPPPPPPRGRQEREVWGGEERAYNIYGLVSTNEGKILKNKTQQIWIFSAGHRTILNHEVPTSIPVMNIGLLYFQDV